MGDKSAVTVPSRSKEREWNRVHQLIAELSEARDLRGLATVAETSVRALRFLVERPVTCSELDLVLEKLERLNLDEWELDE